MEDRVEAALAEEVWNVFKEEILQSVEDNVPKKPKRNGRRSVWMTREILRALRRKRRIWRKEITSNTSEEYREAERKVKNLIRNAKRNFEKKIAKESKGNSRPFYSYLKRRTKSKVSVSPLLNSEGNMVSTAEEMAEVINVYFRSVFTREGDTVPEA